MTFLQLGAAAMAALLLGTLGLVVFLYWLKPPPSRVVVPSMVIWARVLKERKRRSDFWRWLVSLLLALTVGLAIAAAVGRPEVAALTGRARRVVVILDNAPTMGARTASGATRWEIARERARAILHEGGAGSEYLVADTAGQLPRTELGSRRTALERLEELTLSHSETSIAAGVEGLPSSDRPTDVYFVTDGVLARDFPAGAHVVSVFEPVDNVGITAFDLRPVPAEATRYEAFLELANHSAEPKRVLLQVEGAAGVSTERQITLRPEQTLGQTLDLETFPTGPVRALIDAPGDGYDLDNVAYAFLGSLRRVRAVLVTPGNVYLEKALGLDPRIALEVVPPERATEPERPDLYVFDRFAPPEPPSVPSLLFDPPREPWLAPPTGRLLEGLALAGTESDHPLMQHVSLSDVVVEHAVAVDAAGRDVVVGTTLEPIVVVDEAPVRFVQVSFDLAASNLPLQPAFPVFLSNAVSWLTGTDVVRASLGTVAVPVASGGVTDLQGNEVRSRASGARTSFAPEAPGLYSVRGRGRQVVVSANLLSPKISAVNDSVLGGSEAPPGTVSAGELPSSLGDLWLLLLALAFVLALVEWWTYHRRMTV